jgi:two-component system sensor histidine kinase RstB
LIERMQPTFGFPLRLEGRARLDDGPTDEPTLDGDLEMPLVHLPIDDETILVAGPLIGLPRRPVQPLGPIFLVASVSFVSALLIAAPITRRLRTLQRATRSISSGDLSVRVEGGSSDVIGQLANDFNLMAAQLAATFGEREQLIRAVTHEISTPLSRMRFHLEALRGSSDSSRLEALDAELGEIDRLSEELASWIDAGGRKPELMPAPIAPIVESVIERRRLGKEGGIAIAVELEPDLLILADGRQLERAIDNVVSNALRHAKRIVVVAGRRRGAFVEVEVRDDGPGIPIEARTRVFEPFIRLEPSRSRDHGGMGLGLAIADRIVAQHGGAIAAAEAREGGACIRMRFPART